MRIHGFQKTTLLDYPGHLAATIFFGGCNFLCPFCHNASLVLYPDSLPAIPKEEVLATLRKRKEILEGVCITGGEPTLEPGLADFIKEIKDMGYLIKLDTNGSNPILLKQLISEGLLDYVAMDIKNSPEKYSDTIGKKNFSLKNISESIQLLLNGNIDYEFRTTITKEFHIPSDFIAIGEWLKGARAYYLQSYKESEDVISPGFHSYTKDELDEIRRLLLPYVSKVEVRGVD
ncbi:anaerobic ribonucleoside-triphosphate reductase activating protein [Anaerocolumna chitinilytica]|uniref:Anaerobic ribonucleoside-triphosphate reductase activating protein n=1 Tax=Anaerocolumna chitinilytica TaxID=1727145 RepID=A0A7M3SB67_9FIRM|nr:anaerobic ribonucleoside-triphosphate reductase activating protein [Anaerocolumna chitinilytica]BCK01835.1 anaerobic ribonucleoside-triphosphate reductase activating protein [Anaerocolumna chitinilytica]